MLQAHARPPRVQALASLPRVDPGGGGVAQTHKARVPRLVPSPCRRSSERSRGGKWGEAQAGAQDGLPNTTVSYPLFPVLGGTGAAGGEGLRAGATFPLPSSCPPAPTLTPTPACCKTIPLSLLFKTLASGAIMGRKVAGLFYLRESIKLGLGQRAAGPWAAAGGDPGGTSPQRGPRSTCTPSHYRPSGAGLRGQWTLRSPHQAGVKRAELCRSRGCPPKHPVSHLPALAAGLPAQPREQESPFEGKRGRELSSRVRVRARWAAEVLPQPDWRSGGKRQLHAPGTAAFPHGGTGGGPLPFLGSCDAKCRLQSPGKGTSGFTGVSRK